MIEPISLLNPSPVPKRFRPKRTETTFIPQQRIIPKIDIPFGFKQGMDNVKVVTKVIEKDYEEEILKVLKRIAIALESIDKKIGGKLK